MPADRGAAVISGKAMEPAQEPEIAS